MRWNEQWGSRLLRLFPSILIIAGLGLLATVAGMKWQARAQQRAILAAFAELTRATEQQPVMPTTTGRTTSADVGLPAVLPDTEQWLIEAGAANTGAADAIAEGLLVMPIAVLEIPKIDLTVAVGEGVDSHTLRYAVGHFTSTALPGEQGNFSVIGHRNYTFGEFFNRLDELEPGDLVLASHGGRTYTYRVTEAFVVNPEDTWVLNSTDTAEITLVTCTPIRVATHRLIVKGVLEIDEPVEPDV